MVGNAVTVFLAVASTKVVYESGLIVGAGVS